MKGRVLGGKFEREEVNLYRYGREMRMSQGVPLDSPIHVLNRVARVFIVRCLVFNRVTIGAYTDPYKHRLEVIGDDGNVDFYLQVRKP